jgi:SAM-dependent methyltransferase
LTKQELRGIADDLAAQSQAGAGPHGLRLVTLRGGNQAERVTPDRNDHHHGHHGEGAGGGIAPAGVDTPEGWDQRYASLEQVWSGRPNTALLSEVAALPPGRALDVGCGEGADAVWLAARGWAVTALDVSQVALQRAARHGEQAGVVVRWVQAGLVEAGLPPGTFDLVSAQYPALRRTDHHDAERCLLAAVAPGGTLLVVHHAALDVEQARAHGFDPADYVDPAGVAALLDDTWRIDVDETRPREVTSGAGAHHTLDVVLRATRLS